MKKKKLRVAIVAVVFIFCAVLLACAPRTDGANPVESETGAESSGEGTATELVGGPFTWKPESDCALCHSNSVQSLTELACEAAAGDPNSTCMTCHTDAEAIETAHANVTLADTAENQTRLKRSRVFLETCLACHNLEELALATADNTELTDTEGTVANPHEVMTTRNINGTHDEIKCSTCHKMHSEKTPGEVASTYCLTCHHNNTYTCYSCHPPRT